MGLTVQTHPDDYRVELFGEGASGPFAVVKAIEDGATVSLFLLSAAACDELIKAAAEAKRLLSPEPQWCPAVTVLDGETLYCDRDHGHAGSHHAPGPDEGSEVAWGDEGTAPRGEHPYPGDEAARMVSEGITGMYWDNLGSSGSRS